MQSIDKKIISRIYGKKRGGVGSEKNWILNTIEYEVCL